MQLLSSRFIQGDSERVFLNTEVGCASRCSYCYLGPEGFPIGEMPKDRISSAEVLATLRTMSSNVSFGSCGTIFSIGCYSECWDRRNRQETLKLIRGLLPYGNPIQVATKRRILASDLSPISLLPEWQRQLTIYISSATISAWKTYERGTSPPAVRFRSFEACLTSGIKAFLYVKPVIRGVTIKDADAYGQVMRDFGVGVVVGDLFIEGTRGRRAPVGRNLVISPNREVHELCETLSSFGPAYLTSVETVRKVVSDARDS